MSLFSSVLDIFPSVSGLCVTPPDWWGIWVKSKCFGHDPHTIKIYTDASDKGWGAVLNTWIVQGTFEHNEKEWSMPTKETMAVCRGLIGHERAIKGQHILVHSDSIAAVACYQKQGDMNDKIRDECTKRIENWKAETHSHVTLTWIVGKENHLVDRASRVKYNSNLE